ncbi:hypothetical protein [Sphingomicrobium clamense]|uniref:Uncharacterized protein n=1 Tax=Sphingomicrobium clamense TaxID=2851013 RepID=A0ABS6V6W2_9SPHN|nr:hypothetical protein [Sphingomicrobium sp. B8]MBW0144803.1 hypothetical protein [Sphingomicrobium sp. B8]
MHTIVIATAAALTLAACGQEEAAEETVQAEEVSLENEEEAGDVTAIDAATSADANMAPDSGSDDED